MAYFLKWPGTGPHLISQSPAVDFSRSCALSPGARQPAAAGGRQARSAEKLQFVCVASAC
eukprot:COSAG05_NODE_24078_length_254_cov_0.587097_1_plen_59_part_10